MTADPFLRDDFRVLTPEAFDFAKGKPIELVDGEGLLMLLRGVQRSGMIAAAPTAKYSGESTGLPQVRLGDGYA